MFNKQRNRKMAVVKFEPMREIERFIERIGNFFEEAGKGITLEVGGFVPRTNISEDENAYYIEMELPGVHKEKVEILWREDGVLTIKGKKEVDKDATNRNVLKAERKFGTFQRSFEFPDIVDFGNIEAYYDNGVLYVKLPKKVKEQPKAVKVEIK